MNNAIMFIQGLLLFFVLIVLLHIYYRYSHEGRLIGKIKGPKQMFLFGNVWDIWLTPEQTFISQIKWRQMYGDIFKLCGFCYRSVYIYKPEDLEIILSSTKFNNKNFPYIFLYGWLREGLLTSAETAMGINVRNKNKKSLTTDKYFEALQLLSNCFALRVSRLWLFTDFVYNLTSMSRIEKKALHDLHGFTTNVIKERRTLRERDEVSVYYETDDMYGGKMKLAMLDMLLDEEKNGTIDEIGIREEVDTFTFEGHDTTAMALCFMIMRIANEPEVQDTIYKELQQIFGDSKRIPTLEDLTQMKYLECCIKESLRLYPSVSFIARYITEETVLAGHTVPKNTCCHINVFDIHRNPDVFPEPEKFIPERFLPENLTKLHPYSYIPFSAGPRNCIGQKFAMMEMKTVMSSLLWQYRLEPVTRPEDLVFKIDMVLRTNHPIYVRFRNRH